jgi:hypothetical protein
MRHIEHVRAKVGENTEVLVAPRRVADVPRGSVAVKVFCEIDLAETSRIENLLQFGDMWLEPVVVSGVARRTFGSGESDQLADFGGRTEQRFFHQRVFSIGQKVPKNREFFLIWNANAGRVVRGERQILDSLKIDSGRDRIDYGHDFITGDRATLAPLHPETDDR